jgi:hypothetical protein
MPSLLYLLGSQKFKLRHSMPVLPFLLGGLLFTAFGLLSFPHIAPLAPLDRRSEDVRVLPVITELKLGTPRLKIDQKPSMV